jgi:O-methyltransferase involved in polyketide biosynthesis
MIGSSVTDPQWLDQIPTGHPTLVVAEGLLMYLAESEVRQLVARLLGRFDCGELQFDTLAAPAPLMSKVFTRGIIKWGIGNARDIEAWNPKLRLVEQTPALAGYEKIDSTVVRWIYRVFSASPFGPYDMLNRFKY